ncbi:MAG: hypothetical protein KDC85_10650 [Saprospiraceae bacterium]|nr:hypothetical protein [Saprospiraceae bacterium]
MKIRKLTLFTSRLNEQINFYRDTLELKMLTSGKDFAEFRVGSSVLRFEGKRGATPYHFAFNIPSYQENDAWQWLKNRLEIIPFDTQEIIPFENWNANAIYFYDAEKNIVEFIARRNLGYEDSIPFSSESIVEISEIGVPLTDIIPVHEHLTAELSLPVYSGSTERFCAMGDERGLFILINTHKKREWFPCGDKAIPSDFKATISHQGQQYGINFHNEILLTHELKSNHHSFNEFV